MKTHILTIFLLGITSIWTQSIAQEKYPEPPMDAVIRVMEEARPLNMDSIKMKVGYPQTARDKGVEGSVVYRILVDERGNNVKHVLINEGHPILAEAVGLHVDLITFSPALDVQGNPIPYWINIPFNFRLLNEPYSDSDFEPKVSKPLWPWLVALAVGSTLGIVLSRE